ncbi:GNAT family N-acetyltransferase [Streptomyces sp. NBC_00893]|uniref:GNAT family N-acetyltransferase n=1 Tax=Streptomyces sp. NBC_00893 TaxID=2975862 RepID=UPI00225A5A1C|nr:GNAT family protein [Streptomyces sp. NBC_00893]MCX4851130.1 GNAT family N-acetyltransferase [Streptomyces sp. NBC_00893]
MNESPTPPAIEDVVELRPHTTASLEPLLRWKNDVEIQRLSDDETLVFTREQVAVTLERWMRPSDDIVHLAIGLVGRAEPIGFLHLALIERAHRRCRLGIVIGEKELWGHGYGHQAVERAVEHAFDVLDLGRITAEVFADNPRSVRLLEGVGFVREGVMRESIHRDGQRVDEFVFGLLRHEWPGARK